MSNIPIAAVPVYFGQDSVSPRSLLRKKPSGPTDEEVEALMKRCQLGAPLRQGAYDELHNILAECYGTIGALHSRTKKQEGR